MAPESEHLYLELLNRIVEVQRDLYGDLAVKVAAKVKKLELSAEGKVVKIDGPADAAIRDLVWEYESLGGGNSRSSSPAPCSTRIARIIPTCDCLRIERTQCFCGVDPSGIMCYSF